MKRFIASGILIVIVLLIGFHFYVAHEAEKMIDHSLQEQSTKSQSSFTITYSSINISPFKGDIVFKDLNYIQASTITRSSKVTFDLDYIDFLRIYFAGAEYGFKHINDMHSTLEKPSIVFRKSIREAKSKKISLEYTGNMLDLLQNITNQQLLEHKQQLSLRADSLYFSSAAGAFTIDSAYIHSKVPKGNASILKPKELQMKSMGIYWNPPQQIKDTYGFFIRGFEYDPEHIPADSLTLTSNNASGSNQELLDINLYTNLFQARSTTGLHLNTRSLSASTFKDGKIRIVKTTDRFKNFLMNAEQLFGVKIPLQTREIIQFQGPITNPNITFAGNSQP